MHRAAGAKEKGVNDYHNGDNLGLEPTTPMKACAAPTPPAATAAPSDEHVSVVGMPEFDALLDYIYEHGTTSEGVRSRADALARALLARYGQPVASAEPLEVDMDEYRAVVAVMEQIDPATLPGITVAQRCALGRFAKPAGRPAGDAQPVAWVAADTLHSPHPGCVSSLAYVSQIDKDRGREYVPLYAAPVAAQTADDARDAERYRLLRRKVCIVGGKFHILNLDPRYIAPDAAVELDAAIDAAMQRTSGDKAMKEQA